MWYLLTCFESWQVSRLWYLLTCFALGVDISVPEESDIDQNQSDDADPETSPIKSPTTPKNLKCKNSSGTLCPRLHSGVIITQCHDTRAPGSHAGMPPASSPQPKCHIYQELKYALLFYMGNRVRIKKSKHPFSLLLLYAFSLFMLYPLSLSLLEIVKHDRDKVFSTPIQLSMCIHSKNAKLCVQWTPPHKIKFMQTVISWRE